MLCSVLSPSFRGGSVHLFSCFLSPVCLPSLIFCRSLSETILLSCFRLLHRSRSGVLARSASLVPSRPPPGAGCVARVGPGPTNSKLVSLLILTYRKKIRQLRDMFGHLQVNVCGAQPHPRHAPGPRRRSGQDEGGGMGEDPTTGTV